MTTDQTTAPVVIVTPDGPDEAPLPAAVPAILGDAMAASPAEMREELTRQVRKYVSAAREARGQVQVPEDAFPLLRVLTAGADALKHYGRVVRDLENEVRTHAEDEAVEVAGEAPDGTATTRSWRGDFVPAANVTIPDEDGDWHIKREFETAVEVDWHSVISVEARLTSAHAMAGVAKGVPTIEGVLDALAAYQGDPQPDAGGLQTPAEVMEELVSAVAQHAAEATLDRLLFLQSPPKPKSTALEGWAKELSRKGLDDLASIVRTAWSKTRAYRGVSVDRS